MNSGEPSQLDAGPRQPAPSPVLANAPLQRPTLRLQDGDIILEDAALPPAAASRDVNGPFANTPHDPSGVPNNLSSPATPATLALGQMMVNSSQITFNSLQPQLSRDNTNRSAAATPEPRNNGIGSFRLYFDAEPGRGGSSRTKTTELTSSNVQQLTKQAGEPGKASTTERMWKWLADAGPPYDVQPSVGVATRPAQAAASQQSSKLGTQKSSKGGLFACFKCFS